MKPITSLTNLVVSPATSSSPSISNLASDQRSSNQLAEASEKKSILRMSSSSSSSVPSATVDRNSNNSGVGSSLGHARKASKVESLDQKLLSSTKQTSLSVLKVSPLNALINNKVGSSSYPLNAMMSYAERSQSSKTLPVTDRKVRDSASLLIMLAFLSFLGYIIWDGIIMKGADINLVVHGSDSYGNICGRNNQPIKFVEKSGKNYTSMPFTKYTLINSQFERYTLDPSRSKSNELIYVKQDLSTKTNFKYDISRSRPRRSASERVVFDYEQLKRNQSYLKNLKSGLMYQYPPLYGYESQIPAKPSLAKKNSIELKGLDSSEDAQRDLSVSQSEVKSGGAMSPLASTTSMPTRTTVSMVMFDDHINENDSYEHMLINPTSVNTKSKMPDFLSQNEVNHQLLYLTECVDHCPSDHVELIFYRCMPKNWRFAIFPNAINVTRTFIDDILTDMTHCYKELIYIFSFALVLSIALLILLRSLASFIIWSCLTILIIIFLSMASYSWLSYYYQIIDLNNLMPHDSVYTDRMASSDKWLIGSIFLTFLAFAIIGTIIFMRKRILMVTLLFRESGKAIADMPLLLLQPVLTFAALITIIAIWLIGLICLQSMKAPVIDLNTGFVVFKAELLYKVMKWYHAFAFLWVSHFAIACQHYVIGAAVSKWYFSTNRYNLHSPIGSAVSELILYYLGSVALGSFLVAIFKVVRIITRQIHYLVQRNCMSPTNTNEPNQANFDALNSTQQPSTVCGSFSYVWRLLIWFFDNIVMIINRDAYVEIAIHGHSFLAGAKQAFNVLASNPLRLLAIKSVGNVLLVVAKICVVFGTVSIAVILLEEKTNQLNYSWSPVVISAIYAYIVAHWFLSVYEMVIDALFICYCEDHERSKNQATSNQVIGSEFMTQILNNNQTY